MQNIQRHAAWALVAILGACALGVVGLNRGETINALWLVIAAVCTYSVRHAAVTRFASSA